MGPMDERFEMRVDKELLARVDAWRAEEEDLPSRAQAMRRLVEVALASHAAEGVKLSDGEKLLMLMMRDLYRHFDVEGEQDPEFMSQVIFGGHYWAPKWKFGGVFHGHVDSARDLHFVLDVLSMWDQIELGHERLSKAEKDRVAIEAKPFGKIVKFPGFDGNNEAPQLGIAHFLIDHMDRFSRFKGRDLNAHMPTRDMHKRMLAGFEVIEKDILGTALNADQIIALMKAQLHPSRRGEAEE
jgi:uncharacterized protein